MIGCHDEPDAQPVQATSSNVVAHAIEANVEIARRAPDPDDVEEQHREESVLLTKAKSKGRRKGCENNKNIATKKPAFPKYCRKQYATPSLLALGAKVQVDELLAIQGCMKNRKPGWEKMSKRFLNQSWDKPTKEHFLVLCRELCEDALMQMDVWNERADEYLMKECTSRP